jgi:TPP-dependent pyruvate/acetoin dehydrogenase alpha subunit
MSADKKEMIAQDLRGNLYYQMILVRLFEERMLNLFDQGKLSGTLHCCIGQEANAVSVISHLREEDIVVSNHRCHGHYLAKTQDIKGLMAELMGKPIGICGGRGGSQHLCSGNFYTNGILASTLSIAAGMAFAEKKKNSDVLTAVFMGDGAFGEGIVYETFNMIALWQIPVLVVVENNFYAQSTPLSLNCAGKLLDRVKAFGISAGEIETNDVEELFDLFGNIIKEMRLKRRPHIQIINTYRLCPHSKGDDFRPLPEIESWRQKDPLLIQGKRLSDDSRLKFEKQAAEKINEAEVSLANISL